MTSIGILPTVRMNVHTNQIVDNGEHEICMDINAPSNLKRCGRPRLLLKTPPRNFKKYGEKVPFAPPLTPTIEFSG